MTHKLRGVGLAPGAHAPDARVRAGLASFARRHVGGAGAPSSAARSSAGVRGGGRAPGQAPGQIGQRLAPIELRLGARRGLLGLGLLRLLVVLLLLAGAAAPLAQDVRQLGQRAAPPALQSRRRRGARRRGDLSRRVAPAPQTLTDGGLLQLKI